jgi:hypothetical protein
MEFFGLVALLAALAIATVLGFWWRSRQGKVQREAATLIDSKYLDTKAAVTIVMFGSEFCAYCPQQWRLIEDAVSAASDLGRMSIDIAADVAISNRLAISQTPTTLLVSSGGEVLSRIGGLARRDVLQREIEYARKKRRDKNDEYLI